MKKNILPNKIKNLVLLRQINNTTIKIPEFYYFSVKDWKENKDEIFIKLNSIFAGKVAIRSSSLNEDNEKLSNAGKYLSILNIKINSKKDVSKSIDNVINSYGRKNYLSNYVLIQKFIKNVNLSGVAFTKDLISGGPYVVINYDDQSGKTDTITSGNSSFANKVLYVHENYLSDIKSERFKKILIAINSIKLKLKSNYLDIEFCLDNKFNVLIFQARKLNCSRKVNNYLINQSISKGKRKLNNLFGKYNNLRKETILGKMPDWNPVEIIGSNPKNLAFSLYSRLITNKNWYIARKIMGYTNLNDTKLMYEICGGPFIDTYKSFKSLIPKNLNKGITDKLMINYINKLKKNHNLHDKIEFEISLNSFDFNLTEKIKSQLNLNSIEKKKVFNSLHKLFLENLNPKSDGSIEKNIKKIYQLEKKQYLYTYNNKRNQISINKIINDCSKYGVIPFAILARHAFISTNLLNSLVNVGALSKKRSELFLQSIRTVLTKYLEDLEELKKNSISKKEFMNVYGHLRPGTYNIESKRYDKYNYIDFKIKQNFKTNKTEFNLTEKEILRINKLLLKNKINTIQAKELFEYFKKSIEYREYSKFIFTKSVSQTLEIIKIKLKYLKTSEIAYLNLNEINGLIRNKKKNLFLIKNNIEVRKKIFDTNLNIKTPQLIIDPTYINIVPFQTNKPNFITNKIISGNTIFINSKIDIKKINFKNKIILIENADPGYDWLFSKNISGLITKYGGRNSHMAIRCHELKTPAVIGCGEKIFNNLKLSTRVYIDTVNEIVKNI